MSLDFRLDDPQNPYSSFVVTASAGSGKTYQLSHRFLYLIGAGADPRSILTITFTRKAAAEMRSRILTEASRLLYNAEAQENFARKIDFFYRNARTIQPNLNPPLMPQEVAALILTSTQMLRISTIDSLFMEWARKFPWEASLGIHGLRGQKLIDAPRSEEISLQAWQRLFIDKAKSGELENYIKPLIAIDSDSGPFHWQKRIGELLNYESFLWFIEQTHGHNSAVRRHILPELPQDLTTEIQVVKAVQEAIAPVLRQTSKPQEKLEKLLSTRKIDDLVSEKIFTKSGELNKRTFSEKLRSQFDRECQHAEMLALVFSNRGRLAKLNSFGDMLYQLTRQYSKIREKIKVKFGEIEFSDLAQIGFQIFTDSDAAGARYLVHRRLQHLLLDEFQDTSRLQWGIFGEITNEMLSGYGAIDGSISGNPTVFLVGDPKQSIYGFREADPTVISEAAISLVKSGAYLAPLNESYRSASLLLDFVTTLFQLGLKYPNFPTHKTATINGKLAVPDIASITLFEPLTESLDSADEGATAIELEAETIATALKAIFDQIEPKLIPNKLKNGFRPIAPKDCVILYRASTHAHAFENSLRKRGIPVRKEEEKGFFSRPEIRDALSFIRFLAFPSDALSLITALMSPWCGIPESSVISASLATKELDPATRTSAILSLLQDNYADKVLILSNLAARAQFIPPHQLIIDALQTIPILQGYRFIYAAENALLCEQNILQLIEVIMKLETSSSNSLAVVSEQLAAMAARDELANAGDNHDAVTLMTIHKSKGLEFPLVVLADSHGSWSQQDRYWAKSKAAESSTTQDCVYYIGTKDDQPKNDLYFDRIFSNLSASLQEESERLLYVALTRASHHLIVSGNEKKRKSSSGARSFLAAVKDAMQGMGAVEKLLAGKQAWTLESTLSDETRSLLEANQTHQNLPQEDTETDYHDQSIQKGLPELRLISPHRLVAHRETLATESEKPKLPELEKESRATSEKVPRDTGEITRIQGNYIHRRLELATKKIEVNPQAIWTREVTLGNLGALHAACDVEQSFITAEKTVIETLNHPELLALWGKSAWQRAEMPFSQKMPGSICHGVIDWIGVNESMITVVDYKTSHNPKFGSTLSDEQLKFLCDDAGYTGQIREYLAAAMALFGTKKENVGLVFFTALQRLVRVT